MSQGHPPMPEAAPRTRLLELLSDVKHALSRAALIEALVVFASGALFTIVLGAILVWAGASMSTTALVELLLLGTAAAFVLVRYGHLFWSVFRRPMSIALFLDRAIDEQNRAPRDRVALLSAIELAADQD